MREASSPLKTRGHSSTLAHSMQCSGNRGVLAMVQMGKTVGRVCVSIYPARHIRSSRCRPTPAARLTEHSKHDVIVGKMTRAWPLNPARRDIIVSATVAL